MSARCSICGLIATHEVTRKAKIGPEPLCALCLEDLLKTTSDKFPVLELVVKGGMLTVPARSRRKQPGGAKAYHAEYYLQNRDRIIARVKTHQAKKRGYL